MYNSPSPPTKNTISFKNYFFNKTFNQILFVYSLIKIMLSKNHFIFLARFRNCLKHLKPLMTYEEGRLGFKPSPGVTQVMQEKQTVVN